LGAQSQRDHLLARDVRQPAAVVPAHAYRDPRKDRLHTPGVAPIALAHAVAAAEVRPTRQLAPSAIICAQRAHDHRVVLTLALPFLALTLGGGGGGSLVASHRAASAWKVRGLAPSSIISMATDSGPWMPRRPVSQFSTVWPTSR